MSEGAERRAGMATIEAKQDEILRHVKSMTTWQNKHSGEGEGTTHSALNKRIDSAREECREENGELHEKTNKIKGRVDWMGGIGVAIIFIIGIIKSFLAFFKG